MSRDRRPRTEEGGHGTPQWCRARRRCARPTTTGLRGRSVPHGHSARRSTIQAQHSVNSTRLQTVITTISVVA